MESIRRVWLRCLGRPVYSIRRQIGWIFLAMSRPLTLMAPDVKSTKIIHSSLLTFWPWRPQFWVSFYSQGSRWPAWRPRAPSWRWRGWWGRRASSGWDPWAASWPASLQSPWWWRSGLAPCCHLWLCRAPLADWGLMATRPSWRLPARLGWSGQVWDSEQGWVLGWGVNYAGTNQPVWASEIYHTPPGPASSSGTCPTRGCSCRPRLEFFSVSGLYLKVPASWVTHVWPPWLGTTNSGWITKTQSHCIN